MELTNLSLPDKPYQNVPGEESRFDVGDDDRSSYAGTIGSDTSYFAPYNPRRPYEEIAEKDDKPYLVAIDNQVPPYTEIQEEDTSYLMPVDNVSLVNSNQQSSTDVGVHNGMRSSTDVGVHNGIRSMLPPIPESNEDAAREAKIKKKRKCCCSNCCLCIVLVFVVCGLAPLTYFLIDVTMKHRRLQKQYAALKVETNRLDHTLEGKTDEKYIKLRSEMRENYTALQKERKYFYNLLQNETRRSDKMLRNILNEQYRIIATQTNNLYRLLRNATNRNNKTMNERYESLRMKLIDGQGSLAKEIEEVNNNIGIKKDCLELYFSGRRKSGVYTIRPFSNIKFRVYCDQETDGGGWMVFQRRVDDNIPFNRPWLQYKQGFGNLNGNFWLGNTRLHILTSLSGDSQQLRVDIGDWAGHKMYATYSKFIVENETRGFQLKIGKYAGNAGNAAKDSKTKTMDSMKFSTFDRDNDKSIRNCAEVWGGGWWFNDCFSALLNGPYKSNTQAKDKCSGIHWFHHADKCEFSMKKTEMKLRRVVT